MRRAVVALLLLTLLGCASSRQPRPSDQGMEKASEEGPLYAHNLLRQGSLLLQQQRFDDALAKFKEAERLQPGNATIHNMIGVCHLQQKDYPTAIAAFERALELVPSFTDARNNRGAAYLHTMQYQLAQVDFGAVLADSTYPHRWEAYYNQGMAFLGQNQVAAAEEHFRRAALAVNPVPDAFLRLAEIAESSGRSEAAVDLLEEARLKFPDRKDFTLALGRLLTRSGRTQEARPLLEEVIGSSPGSPEADEAKALLGRS